MHRYHFVSDGDFDSLRRQRPDAGVGPGRRASPASAAQFRIGSMPDALRTEIDLADARQVRRAAMPSPPRLPSHELGRSSSISSDMRYRSAQERERLTTARTELDAAGEFDHVVINDTVASAPRNWRKTHGIEQLE